MPEESVAPQETKCKNCLFQLKLIVLLQPIKPEVTMPFALSFILLLLLPIFSFGQTSERPVIPDDVLWEPDVEYLTAGAKAVNLAMDVVAPKGNGGPYPAVVCIHGGGFRTRARRIKGKQQRASEKQGRADHQTEHRGKQQRISDRRCGLTPRRLPRYDIAWSFDGHAPRRCRDGRLRPGQ